MNELKPDIENLIEFFAQLNEPDTAYGKRAAELLKPFSDNLPWNENRTAMLCGAVSKGILEWSCSNTARVTAEKKCDEVCAKAIRLTY
jgi:hypothetical protein